MGEEPAGLGRQRSDCLELQGHLLHARQERGRPRGAVGAGVSQEMEGILQQIVACLLRGAERLALKVQEVCGGGAAGGGQQDAGVQQVPTLSHPSLAGPGLAACSLTRVLKGGMETTEPHPCRPVMPIAEIWGEQGRERGAAGHV